MKKRILSLILALSMVLSVLPLGAFAEGSNQGLTIGSDGYPTASNGNGWSYDHSTKTLTLTEGTFDFSSTAPVQCAIKLGQSAAIAGGTFNGAVTNDNHGNINNGTFNETVINANGGLILGGNFNGDVTNSATIINGTFKNEKKVINNAGGEIGGGNFNGNVENNTNGTIYNGKFTGTVTNSGTIKDGTFAGSVTNNKTISGGTFQNGCSVTNWHTIKDNGTFEGTVTNYGTIENGTFKGDVTNKTNGLIYGGTFQNKCSVTNYGTITGNGTFNGTVTNDYYIKNGTFKGDVTNKTNGIIYDGTFAGSVTNSGTVNSGVFKGKNNLTNVYAITWDTAYPNAKIEEVNDVSVDWPPYVCAGTTVTITANTEIFSLNGKSIGDGNCKSSYGSGNNIVTFTMPDEDVVLNRTAELEVADGEIESGETAKGSGRVLIGGKVEVTTKDKTQDFVGWTIAPEGIELRHDDGSAVDLTSEQTFSFMMPDVSGGKLTLTADYQPFRTSLLMNADGTVNLEHVNHETYDGNETCKGDGWNVFNRGTLILEKWTYDFQYTAPTEKTGTLEAVTCEVLNEGGTIENGVFRNIVLNEVGGTITGGTFAAGLFEMPGTTNGNVTGGVFNGKTGLTNAHHVTVTDGSVLKVNGEDPLKVDETTGAVTTDTAWDLYSYKDTTMTIIASTEIFSLNGKSIGDGNCKSSYDGSDYKTVKFTMPGEPVVLNGAITCTDLVMEKGWPKASNEGTISCEGTDWSYDHITKTLTLTSGEYDFSSTEPVQCAIQSSATITGGTFEKKVTNNAGGIISGGTFQDTCSVTNNGTIKKGTFKNVCSVTNEGANATIENGTFKNMCRVTNNSTIENGTFKDMCSVENTGTINNGTFTYKVENNGIITGGVFNGNANLTGVTGGHSITVASNAKIEKVNGVSADWAPYVVTSNATTKEVTITADTEIFSLNGQPIAESSYGSDKTTVTFTMPDDDVVLNKAITSTDLVMKNGYPKDSDGGKTPARATAGSTSPMTRPMATCCF